LYQRTWDAFDFFTVSLTVTEIARDFGVENSEVTWVSAPEPYLSTSVKVDVEELSKLS
jgi:hypothetical protein